MQQSSVAFGSGFDQPICGAWRARRSTLGSKSRICKNLVVKTFLERNVGVSVWNAALAVPYVVAA